MKSKFLKDAEKHILKGWGPKCKDFSALCSVCLMWQAFETMKSLEDMKCHLTEWTDILPRK
jgi:hypothetical protein